MLTPEDRSTLLDDLRPPSGMVVDAAVATTFTLSLAAALLPPLAISAQNISSTTDPVVQLASLRQASDRIDIFCQAGLVEVPAANDLVAFLEPMVHQVGRPPGGLFHPKLWLLRFAPSDPAATNPGQYAYRLLVLSRNLTLDNSWDVTVRLDSAGCSGSDLPENRPLADLVSDLVGMCVHRLDASRAERVRTLADQVRRVHWEPPAGVEGVAFHRGRGELPDMTGRRRLVISPFLNDKGLEIAGLGAGPMTVVSRPESLNALPSSTVQRLQQCYVMSSLDSYSTGDDPTGGLLRDLHAKAYVIDGGPRSTKSRVASEGRLGRVGRAEKKGAPRRADRRHHQVRWEDGRRGSARRDELVPRAVQPGGW